MIRLGVTYPAVGLLLKLLLFVIPSLSAKRASHLAFVEAKTQKRLDRKTDRNDFMTYASFSASNVLGLC